MSGLIQRAFAGGRPPFAPLRLAARALAADFTLPPRRPRATAAGSLRGTDVQGLHPAHGGRVEAVLRQHHGGNAPQEVRQLPRLDEGQRHHAVSGGLDVLGNRHTPIIKPTAWLLSSGQDRPEN